jgi:hypothetical protein
MWALMTTETRKARKRYLCNAWEWIEGMGVTEHDVDSDEDKVVIKRGKTHIEKGDEYVMVKGIYDGEWCVYRADVDNERVCSKYGIGCD